MNEEIVGWMSSQFGFAGHVQRLLMSFRELIEKLKGEMVQMNHMK
jgi:hypothetical protein